MLKVLKIFFFLRNMHKNKVSFCKINKYRSKHYKTGCMKLLMKYVELTSFQSDSNQMEYHQHSACATKFVT